MSKDAFHCSTCGHDVIRHTIKRWPAISKFCQDCGCTGYQPNYRTRGN